MEEINDYQYEVLFHVSCYKEKVIDCHDLIQAIDEILANHKEINTWPSE